MATYIPRFSVKCSFIRFIPNMQCWNILIQIYSSKQTEPKHTKPRFAVICPLGVSFHNYKCSPTSSFIQNGRCYKNYKFLELINTALIQVKMSSNLICENYFLPFHADLFFKKYIKIFCSESWAEVIFFVVPLFNLCQTPPFSIKFWEVKLKTRWAITGSVEPLVIILCLSSVNWCIWWIVTFFVLCLIFCRVTCIHIDF